MYSKMTMLMILGGFGINEKTEGNAVKLANIPYLKNLLSENPNTIIHTSGKDVGLPEGQMGNSEVGHTNIGAGRIIYQDLAKITKEIEEGDFFSKSEFVNAIENCKKNGTNLHIMGLISDGGVHSHNRQLFALLELAKRKDFENVYIHCFTDGRDCSPVSGEMYLQELERKIQEKGVGKIATISGRFYAMDRDKKWERIEKVYNAIVRGKGNKFISAIEAIEESYRQEVFDEFVVPSVIVNINGEPVVTVKENDSIIFFNFRPDRARELTRSLVDPFFKEFKTDYKSTYFVSMTQYDENLPNVHIAYPKQEIRNPLGEYISNRGLTQLRIAETEKYPHVTFYFDGGEEKQIPREKRILVDSPKVESYEMQPEMSAYEVTEKVLEAINSEKFDLIVVTYANPDMVGHTGNIEATCKALETIDNCVQKVVTAIKEHNGILLITSDHGNCEQMIDYETGEPHTAHTTNPVPLAVINLPVNKKLKEGRLADIAPTILDILGLEKPDDMTGDSLLIN